MTYMRISVGESYEDRSGRIVEIKKPFAWMLPGLLLGNNNLQYTLLGRCYSAPAGDDTFDLIHDVTSNLQHVESYLARVSHSDLIKQKAVEALDKQFGFGKDTDYKAIREDPVAYKIYQCALNALMEEMSNARHSNLSSFV